VKTIINEIKNIKSDKKELRKFGIVIAFAFFLVSVFLFIKNSNNYLYFLIPGITILFLGLTLSIVLLPFQKIWMGIAIVIGFYTSIVILGILFYLVITPISLLLRLLNKKLLDLDFEKSNGTLWTKRIKTEFNKSKLENQF